MALALEAKPVGQPHVPLTVDVQAVRKQDRAGTEALQELSVCVELHDRIECRFRAGEWRAKRDLVRWPRLAAAFGHPDAGAVRIDRDRAGGAPFAATRKFAPVFDGTIGIWERIC